MQKIKIFLTAGNLEDWNYAGILDLFPNPNFLAKKSAIWHSKWCGLASKLFAPLATLAPTNLLFLECFVQFWLK